MTAPRVLIADDTPASLALLGASFEEEAGGRAVGVWAGASGLMVLPVEKLLA